MWLVVEPATDGVPALAVPLRAHPITVGRCGECDLVVADQRLSRKHVVLRADAGRVSFFDLGSSGGTFLNGTRSISGDMGPADRLRVGATILRVVDQDPMDLPQPTAPAVLSTSAGASSPPSTPTPTDWQPFGAFVERLRSSSDPKGLLECLLLGLVDLFRAERGFVLLRPRIGAELTPVASHKVGNTEAFVGISRTVYERALETGQTVFIADTMQDEWYLDHCTHSLLDQSRSIVCGPLGSAGQTFGVIYVDAPRESFSLDRGHLPLFESMTGLASELLAANQTRRSLLTARGCIEALNTLAWEGEQLILGPSRASKALHATVEAAARQDVTVLITGETGTGKEMVARALHRGSSRAAGPFVPVNCAALPRDMIEAELFGAEKGAYTGAVERRVGRFELATTGTLFLDEVGELPLDFQVKLLRILQERTVTRLGGTKPLQLDFRLVCATNSNLEAAIAEGSFRQDFYYRVNVFQIELAPLRERREDIVPLANHFLEFFAARFGGHRKGLSSDAERLILDHPWPGNVRELKNAIERAMVVEQGDEIEAEALPIRTGPPRRGPATLDDLWESLPEDYDTALEEFERAFLVRALRVHGGNVSAVARQYGKTRKAIYRRLAKLGLVDGAEEPED